jgi:hypothetical protein
MRLQADSAEISTALLEATGRVVDRFVHSAIMQEVPVELRLTLDSPVVVSFTKFINRQSALRRIRLE